jgi:hypothetical protein
MYSEFNPIKRVVPIISGGKGKVRQAKWKIKKEKFCQKTPLQGFKQNLTKRNDFLVINRIYNL